MKRYSIRLSHIAYEGLERCSLGCDAGKVDQKRADVIMYLLNRNVSGGITARQAAYVRRHLGHYGHLQREYRSLVK